MNSFLIFFGIVATALTPTIAIVVTRYYDKKEREERDIEDRAERQQVAKAVTEVAVTAAAAADSVDTVAGRVEVIAAKTEKKLDEIHTLVDGRLTRAMAGTRAALVGQRSALAELVRIKEAAGQKPAPETVEALAELNLQIADLDVTMSERATLEAQIAAAAEEPLKPPPKE